MKMKLSELEAYEDSIRNHMQCIMATTELLKTNESVRHDPMQVAMLDSALLRCRLLMMSIEELLAKVPRRSAPRVATSIPKASKITSV